ncbi:hypothetical protein OIU78_001481 [Salix suchowensis]|nr:hypothetical protein OIU78_001481 [Salix suchowensis]
MRSAVALNNHARIWGRRRPFQLRRFQDIDINSDDQQQHQYDFNTDAFSAVFSSRLEPVETGYCCSRRRSRQQPLPVACRFEKVQKKDESCSICLVEMEEEDAVSQLSRCMHVFHMDCIDKWIQRDHFTCPLCRTSIDDDDD